MSQGLSKIGRLRLPYTLRLLALIAFIGILTPGCWISYTITEDGVREEERVDRKKLVHDIMELANERASAREASAELTDDTLPYVVKAHQGLGRVLDAFPSKASLGDIFTSAAERTALQYYTRERVRLVVLARDAPLAESFPNGRIYVTSGLIDPLSPFGASNTAQLHGALAHEVAHLVHGDVFRQWIDLVANSRTNRRKILSALTLVVPFFDYDYKPGASYDDVEVRDKEIEFFADLAAAETVEKLGDSPNEYLNLLSRISVYAEGRGRDQGHLAGVKNRRTCLEQRFSPRVQPTQFGANEEEIPRERLRSFLHHLCRIACTETYGRDQEVILAWLSDPRSVHVESLLSQLSAEGRERWGRFGYRPAK